MSWFRLTKEELLAEAEYHRARWETYEEMIKTASGGFPSSWVADRGLEAKYRKLAETR